MRQWLFIWGMMQSVLAAVLLDVGHFSFPNGKRYVLHFDEGVRLSTMYLNYPRRFVLDISPLSHTIADRWLKQAKPARLGMHEQTLRWVLDLPDLSTLCEAHELVAQDGSVLVTVDVLR